MIYVLSDIHGNLNNFNSIMAQINLQETDTLYVLGDVIDRHPDGIRILRRIMSAPNIKMLLGNHEYMMLKAIDVNGVIDYQARSLWYYNGGDCTHKYIKHIRKSIREEIFEYIESLPLNIDIEVGGKKYKLVHGYPKEYYIRGDFEYPSETYFAVWKRIVSDEEFDEDYTLIFGHTPTHYYQLELPLQVWFGKNVIGIDCGSGFPDYMKSKGRLACLRLDDMKVFYSDGN